MSKPTIVYARALDCSKSPHNVRSQSDPVADAELTANIGENQILIQNLIGVLKSRQKGCFEIYAGGRRLDGVHANIASGILDEDFMVPVLVVRSAAEAIAMSLEENYYALRMNPADECRAFQTIIDRQKKTAAELAKRLGVTERFVLGRLRLANLAEPIFEALRTGLITLDIAKAYGATADIDRQAKLFDQMQGRYERNNPNAIRRQLAVGSFLGGDPKALLVGRDAYVEAGGRIDPDLFTDKATELWIDGDIVERLAEQALVAAADAIREREGFAEVRPIVAASVPYMETYHLTPIEAEPRELAPEAQLRQTEIETELAEIEQLADAADGYTEEQVQAIEDLEAELEALTEVEAVLTPEQKAGAVAYVVIGPDGSPRIHQDYFAVEAQVQVPEDDPDGETEGDGELEPSEDDAADGHDGDAYSQRLLDELAMMKTELLALHVASDPAFALDLGTFIMVDDACSTGWTGMPSELRARAPASRVSGYESDTQAAKSWTALDDALDRSWLAHTDIAGRYDGFCALSDEARAAWLGWAIARTLHAVPEGRTGSSFLDHLGVKLGIDVAAWWRPTARNFFDRLTKSRILEQFDAIGGRELRNRYAASRKFDLAAAAEKLFAGQIIADADIKDRALAWLPGPMCFAPPSDPIGEPAGPNDVGEAPGPDMVTPHCGEVEGLPEAA